MTPLTTITGRTLVTVTGAAIAIPDPERLVHLQFRRFAGCPICHRHLRGFVVRQGEIAAAGIREVVVFHSGAAELRDYAAEVPMDLIAGPDKLLYREFGVESAPPNTAPMPTTDGRSTNCSLSQRITAHDDHRNIRHRAGAAGATPPAGAARFSPRSMPRRSPREPRRIRPPRRASPRSGPHSAPER